MKLTALDLIADIGGIHEVVARVRGVSGWRAFFRVDLRGVTPVGARPHPGRPP